MKIKMNSIVSGLFLSGMLLGTASCSDSFLQVDNPNEVSSSTFWKTEDDALMALAACYDAFQDGNLYNDNIDGWKFGFMARETSTDNGDHSWGDWMLGSSISKGTSATTDECFSMYWNANYELIKRCNMVISNVDNMPIDEGKKTAFKAEAIALRALGYCNLTSTFRDVPYLDKPLTLTEPEAAKTPKQEIVTKILADLETNLPNLPTRANAGKGRMSQEAGYAIMGRLALYDQRWKDAVKAYENVIGKATLFTVGDGSNYHDNFRTLFTEKGETADEILLSVHYKGPGLGEGSSFGICWGEPMNAIEGSMNLCDDYYCIDGLPIDKSPLFKGSLQKGGHTKENPDYERYENRDPRMKATLMLPGMDWAGKKYTNNLPATSTTCILKYFIPEDKVNEYDSGMDFYIIRYAEVLLSMAEAKIESGAPQAEVTKYINEVRARVGMPSVEQAEGTGLNQDQLRQIVRHERRVELAFEDLRMADLYRWGEWEEGVKRMQHDKEFYGFGCYTRTYRGPQDDVWPIPQGDIDTNSLLEQHAEWK